MILRGLTILCVISSALISCNRSKYFRTTLAGREYPAGYDRNGDGITDIQAIRAQLNPADPNLASEDNDGDGLTNLWEIKLGFDPKVADSANSLNGNKFGGNGVTDCQEDLVGDGIPICWKIKNGIDPATGNRSLTDLDGDGYSDLEEYTAGTEATSANSRPGGGTADENGALAAVLTLKGTTSEYTEVTRVTGTMSYCASGEQVLFTSGATKPEVNDPGFVACSTASDALTGTLAAVKTGTYKMYAWRKIGAGVVETPLSASILYAPRAADGGLSVNPYSNKTLSVALAAPPGTQYKSVRLFRYSELNCSSRTVDDVNGTEITAKIGDSLILASGLSYTTPYCFKAFWKDAVGNVATRFGSYPGVGPAAGNLSISGYSTQTINLAHTPPTSEDYAKLDVRRMTLPGCDSSLITDGTAVPMGKSTTSYSDTNLLLQTAYCYKAFWADAFGNFTSATVHYSGLGPTAGSLSISGYDTQTIKLAHTPTTSADYAKLDIRRMTLASCDASLVSDGTAVPIAKSATSYSDTNLQFQTAYCYKAFWADAFGNYNSSTVKYSGTGPSGGSVSIASLANKAIYLSVVNPSQYKNLTFYRLTSTSAPDSNTSACTVSSGVTVTLSIQNDGTYKDINLELQKAYCYKASWSDDFGNVSTATVPQPYPGDATLLGQISVNNSLTSPSSITLNLTPPTSAYYSTLNIRQNNSTDCSSITTPTSGSAVANSNISATSAQATGLSPHQAYCFVAFWADNFGNSKFAPSTAPWVTATTTSTGCCWLPNQQQYWYADTGYGGATAKYYFALHPSGNSSGTIGTITEVTDPSYPSARPAFLNTVSSVSSGSIGTSLSFVGPVTGLSAGTVVVTGTTTSTAATVQWGLRINQTAEVLATTNIINTDPTFSTTPDVAIATSAASGTISAVLDALYDGSDASLQLVMANGTTTVLPNSAVGLTDSDIPNLTYTDSSHLGSAIYPYIYNVSSSYSSSTASGVFKINWTDGRYDQGIYDIKTRGYLNVDGAKIYGKTVGTSYVTLGDKGSEKILTSGLAINESFFGASTWFTNQPAIALSEKLSSATDQIYGIAYTALQTNYNQYLGKVEVTHSNGSGTATPTFDNTTDPSPYLIPSTSANTDSVAIASSDSGAAKWLVLSGISNGATTNLWLTNVNTSDMSMSRTALTTAPDNFKFNQVAMTPAFLDTDGIARHGIAFYYLDNTNPASISRKIFFSKIKSPSATAAPAAKAEFFDATGYYDTSNSIKTVLAEAVAVNSSDLASTASLVHMTTANESGTNYFYFGWRKHTDSKVYFARARADGTTKPLVFQTKSGDEISTMGLGSLQGRASYSIAGGQDNAGSPNSILGTLFSQDDSVATGCQFRAYKYDSATNELIKVTTSDLKIGTTADCRFPQLFWNSASKKFMALWVDGDSGATYYADFTVSTSSSTLTPSSPTEIVVTAARTGSPPKSVCSLVAQYSPTSNSVTVPRIGIVSVESIYCSSAYTADLRFDLFKPQR